MLGAAFFPLEDCPYGSRMALRRAIFVGIHHSDGVVKINDGFMVIAFVYCFSPGLRPSSLGQVSVHPHMVRSPSILTRSGLRPFSHGQVSVHPDTVRSLSILTQ